MAKKKDEVTKEVTEKAEETVEEVVEVAPVDVSGLSPEDALIARINAGEAHPDDFEVAFGKEYH